MKMLATFESPRSDVRGRRKVAGYRLTWSAHNDPNATFRNLRKRSFKASRQCRKSQGRGYARKLIAAVKKYRNKKSAVNRAVSQRKGQGSDWTIHFCAFTSPDRQAGDVTIIVVNLLETDEANLHVANRSGQPAAFHRYMRRGIDRARRGA